ncbi:Twitchin, partial [Araneus ventricosus]
KTLRIFLPTQVVKTENNVEVVSEDYKTRITINDAQRRDTGIYSIIAENEVGRDEAEVEFVVLGAPSRPTGPLKVSDVTAKGCKLKWSKPEDDGGKPIAGYAVEKLDTSTGNWVPVGRTDIPEMDVTGLTPGKEYQFRVKAINPEGESEPLVTDRATVAKNPYDEPGAPGTPEIVDWDENHVDLKWTPPKNDGGAPITGYIVEKKERYGPGWEPCLTTSSPKPEAKVEGLQYGNNYQFRVKAVNKAGPGEPSEPTKSHTAKPRYLAPKIVRDNMQQIVVKAGQSVKLDVEVIGEPPPTCTWTFGGKPLEIGDSIKVENEEYNTHLSIKNGVRKQSGKYKLAAVNNSGKDEEEVEIIFLDKPSKPEGPLEVSDVHAEGCKLKWNKPKDDGGTPITGYALERMDPTTGRWIPAGRVDKDKTEAPITGLDPGKKYQFRVKALNDEGESEPLETERATLAKNPYDEPGPPGLPEITDYDTDFVNLKWEPPKRDGGAPITGYVVEKKDKYSTDWTPVKEVEGNIPQAKVTGLNEGDKYEFRVRAVNKAGPGEPSQSTSPHLAKPKNLKPRIDRTNLKNIIVKANQMVNFDVDIIGEPPPKVQWHFEKKRIDDGDVYNINNVDYNSKFCLPKAARKHTGIYCITATNSSGSDEAEVEITVLSKPMRPNGPLEVSNVSKEGCSLKWKKPDDDGGSPIEYYEIEKMDTETGMWVPAGRSEEPKFDVKNLVPGKNYKFRVRAVNKEGDSDELQSEKAILAKNPFDEPSKPGRPEATDWDSDHVDLKWKTPESDGGAPITGYLIEKKKKGTYKWHKAKETSGPSTSATVEDLEEREEYEFRVIALNKAGPSEPSEPSQSVVAKPRSLAPRIDRTNLGNLVIKAGNVVKLDADVKGEPPPKITWAFKGEQLVNGEKVKIDNEEYHTLFILSKTKRSDTGKYTVTAVNSAGKDEVEVEITVLGKPSKPKGPLEVSDVHAEGCKLKWDKPEDDGGQPVKEYVVEKMDTDTGRWIPVTTTKDPEAEISGLIPGKEYKFRVKAVNPEGESEPLETSTGTVAKNPFNEPGKPGKPTAHDWAKHYADLMWKPPESDGGAPITSYIIEKKDKYSTKWQKATETIGDKCEARVSDLIEGMEYNFRVRAVNKAGPSEPSDPSSPVTAKPRFLAPQISGLKDITVRAGQTVKLDAKVIGEPPPKKLWFLGKEQLKSGGRITIETEDYRTKLTINSADRRDVGEYKLCVDNASGKDEAIVNLVVLDKPGKPGGPLDISDINAEGCKLKWKEPQDDGGSPIEFYAVEKMDMGTGRWVPAGRSSKPELELNNLLPGQEYKFRVMAVSAEGESTPLEAEKSIIAKNPYDPPGKPGIPEPTDWDKEWVDLKWTKPLKDGGNPVTGYLIEKKEKDSNVWSKAAQIDKPVCEGRVENLIPGETYQYRVKAINAAGPGEPSDATKPLTAKPRKMPPRIDRRTLKPITVKAGQPFSMDVKIAGEPPPNVRWMLKDGPVPERYDFQIKNVPYNSKIECEKAERKDSGIYKIFASNPHGQDQADVEITVLSKSSKPEGPLEVSDVKKDGCKLKWNKPKDDGGHPLEGYLVEKQDPESGTWVPVGKTHSPEMEVTGLTPGKPYNFRVKALNPEGESDPLETYQPIIAKDPFKESGAPGKPEVTDWNKDHADLKWTAPENDGGAPVTAYVVEKKEKGGPWEKALEVPGDKLKATVPNLAEGKEYEFRVVPINKAGPGEPSDPSNAIIAKPRFLRPTIDRSMFDDLTVKAGQPIKFDVNVSGEPPPTITWQVNDRDLKGETRTTLENVDYNTKLTIRRVTRGDSGRYTINAVNESGKDTATVSVLVVDAPLAPEGPLEVSDVHKEGCKLKWKKPKDDGGVPLQGYEVEKMDPDTGTWLPVGKTREPEMEVTGLTPGKDYKFRVRAVNKEGESDPLETKQATTAKNPFDEPGKPSKPEVTDWDKDHVDLKWTPPASDGGSPITGYIVEKKDKWGDWEKALEVPADETKATVPNLIQGQPYEFRVKAVNKAGPGEPSAPTDPVIAKSRKVPPKIDRTNLNKVRVKAGQSFHFDVNVTGEPAPTIAWLKNGKKILSSDTIKLEDVPYNTKLSAKHVRRGDGGKFTIVATNEHGKDEAEVEVIVLDHPSPPNGPLKIEDVHAEGCNLKWFPPSDDGGVPIDHYEVEKLDPQSGQWVPAGETIGADTNLKVKGLTPGKEYKFRVKAVNRLGESEPLTAQQAILAKNPYDPPSPPGQPEVADYDKDFVTLKWKKPLKDGGSPITGYVVEKKDKYNPDWVPIQDVPGDEERTTIPDLVEGNQYEFRIRAVNKAGTSEPSEPTAPHIAKHKKQPPKIDRNAMFNIRVKAGKTFELDVPVSGEPPPVKKWNLGTKECETLTRWTVVNQDYSTKLSVRNAERGDSGQLTLTARNQHGNDSATITITVLAPPSAPEAMQISNVTKDGCLVAWRPPKDDGGSEISHYLVEKKDTESGKWVPIGESINPQIRADKLIEGHEYQFRVRAVNKEGESPWLLGREPIVAKNPFDQPDKPGAPQVVDWDSGQVDLAWNPPRRDGGAPITGYIIEKKPKNSPVWEEAARVDGNDTRATVPGLKDGDEYEFRVTAVNKAGPSEPSEPCAPALIKPKYLAPSLDKSLLHDIKVRVGRPINYAIPIKGEPTPTVQWTINNKPAVSKRMEILSTATQTTLDIMNSERGDSGKYTLTLQNTSGTISASANVIVMDRPSPPEGPLGVTDVCKDSATLTWKASKDDGGSPIKHYLVEKMDTTRGTWSEVGTTLDLKFKVPKLIYKKRYHFRVKAVNEVGESDPLETKQETIAKDAYEPPQAPGKPQVTDHDKDRVDLAWTAPKDTGGAPLTGYTIQKKERGSPIWTKAADVPASQTKCTVPGLTEGNDYEFRVIANNKAGESEPSDPSDFVTAKPKFLPPKIMTPLREMKVRGGMTLTADIKFIGEPPPAVEWSLDGKPVTSADRVTISNFDDHTILNIIDVKRSDSGPYTLTIKNEHGKDSGILDVNILDKPGPPEGPLNIDEVDKDRVKLSWKPPKDDGGSPLTGYIVEKRDKTRGGSWLPAVAFVNPTSRNCVVPKLTEGTEYEFRIMAQNANGISEPLTTDKPVVAKSPYGVPGRPGQPEPVDYDRDFIKLKWEPPRSNGGSPIIGYDIERKDKKSNRWVKVNKDPVPSCIYTDNTVTDGHQYEYRVTAKNAAGLGQPSEASVPIVAKPMKEKPKLHLDGLYGKVIRVKAGDPLNISMPLTGAPIPTVDWAVNDKRLPPTNRIQTKTTEDSISLSIPVTQRSDSGKYTVTAKNAHGEDSADITVLVYDKPGPPKNLEYPEVTAGSVTLKWKKPDDDGGSDITGYQVEKCEVGVERWTPVASFCPTTTCVARNLDEGKQYRFRVRAENMHGVSEPLEGKPVYAKNPFDTPDAPGQPKVKDFGPNFANIAWTPPTNDGGKPITGYIIEKRERGTPDWFKVNSYPTPHTEFNVPNLTEGKTYEFRVMAVNEGGPGKPSKPSSPITAKEQKFAPSAPDMPRVDKVTKNSVTLSWGKPLHDGGSKIQGYLIEKKPKGAKEWDIINTVPHPDTTFTVPNLKEGEEYEFRVIAVNDVGDSPPSRPCDLVKVEDQPDKPRIDAGALKDITVKAGEEFSLTASFTGFPKPNAIWSRNEVDLDDKDPRCFFKVGDDYAVLGISNAKRSDSGQYKLFLKNISGFDTCYCKVTVLDRPGPPEHLKAEDVEGDSLTLKWSPPKDDGGAEVTNYIVEKREKGTTIWSRVSSFVNGTSTRVRNLTVGRQYEFRVMAENLYGTSDPATMDPVYAKLPFDPPGAPGIPHSVETSTDSITLSWTKPRTDGGSPITGYVLEKRKIGDNKWSRTTNVTIPGLTHRVAGLQENQEYEFRVAACNEAGQGPWSSNSDGIVARMPPCPPKLDTSFAMRDLTVPAGDPFTIRVPYIGSPPPTALWTVNQNEIKPDDRVSNEVSEDFVVLINKKSKREDSGRYTLKLTNSQGTDSASCRVNVVDKPGPPQGPLEISDISPENCSLSWKPPLDDGGSPVTNYVVEKLDPSLNVSVFF